jgi:hypothetical protein
MVCVAFSMGFVALYLAFGEDASNRAEITLAAANTASLRAYYAREFGLKPRAVSGPNPDELMVDVVEALLKCDTPTYSSKPCTAVACGAGASALSRAIERLRRLFALR